MTVVIKNLLNQRLIINLTEGKNLDILAKGSTRIAEDELSSEHLKTLIAKGDIAVIQANSESRGRREIAGKSGNRVVKKKKVKKSK